MKIGNLILFLVTAFVLNSCSVDKCDVDCTSGPLGLNFQLLEKTTGEDLFTNGTFDPEDIEVLDLDNNNSNVQFTFNSEDNRNIISLGPFGWGTDVVNYALKLGDRKIFTLRLDTEKNTENCCSFVQINKLEIEKAEYLQNPETGIYEILVEL